MFIVAVRSRRPRDVRERSGEELVGGTREDCEV